MKSLREAAAELALQAADRLARKIETRETPAGELQGIAGVAWSTEQVLEDPVQYLQVVIYLGRNAPRAADPTDTEVNDLPRFPDQGELLL